MPPYFDTRTTGADHRRTHDPDRKLMSAWFGEEIKREKKRYVMVWQESTNTQHEGCKLLSLSRDGEGRIETLTFSQMELGPRPIRLDDIRALQVGY